MKVRFANRDGKFYCTVINTQSTAYCQNLSLACREVLEKMQASRVSITSAGHGRMTFRFSLEGGITK